MTGRTIPNAFNVLPILVYRVFPDGREELVRGVDLIGTPLTAFSSILQADDEMAVFNGTCGAESGGVPVSAVSPGLLLSQIEVQKKDKSQETPPILSPAPLEIPPDARRGIGEIGETMRRLILAGLIGCLLAPCRVSRRRGRHRDEGDARRDAALHEGAASRGARAPLLHLLRRRGVRRHPRLGQFRQPACPAGWTGSAGSPSRCASATMTWTTRTSSRCRASEEAACCAAFGGRTALPLEDDYQEIRRQIWLATDGAYKDALENLSRKKAALQNKTRSEEIPDFSREEPFTADRRDAALVEVDTARAEALVRDLSALVPGDGQHLHLEGGAAGQDIADALPQQRGQQLHPGPAQRGPRGDGRRHRPRTGCP